MSDRRKRNQDRNFVSTTYLGPKPGDFPVGSLQSRAAMRAMIDFYAEEQRMEEEALLAAFTPDERASIQAWIEDVDRHLLRLWLIYLMRVAKERAIIYERPLSLPTSEEIRHKRAISKEIDRMTDGKASSIENSDRVEWNRSKVIAEENLRAKKK